MKTLIAALLFLLAIVGNGFAQNKSQSPCSRYDDRDVIALGNGSVGYYVEVCTVPNPEDKPALSVIFSSVPDGRDAMRIYSNVAGKPLNLDGVYVERNGQKQFILHPDKIEWANGTSTQLDGMEAKKKKKIIGVVESAFQLLKMAAQNRRVSSTNDQERIYRNIVVDFMFNYQLGGHH